MYIVSSNSIHKDTITIFGSFKTLFGAKKFINEYQERVKLFLDSKLVKKYFEYKEDVTSEEFKQKLRAFPNDRILNATLSLTEKYRKGYLKSAKLYGLELQDNLIPFQFTEDKTEYIDRIDYPINIKVKEDPNWRKEL